MKKIILGTIILLTGHIAIAQERLPSLDKKTDLNIETLGIEVDNKLKVYYPSVTVLKSDCGDVGHYLYQDTRSPIYANIVAKSYENRIDLRGQPYKKEFYVANIADSCKRKIAIEKTELDLLLEEESNINNNSVASIEKNTTSF